MDTDAHEWESDLTEVVIGAGFLEKVYERALAVPAHPIRGVLLKPDDAPAEKIDVTLAEGPRGQPAFSVESKPDGTFEFPGAVENCAEGRVMLIPHGTSASAYSAMCDSNNRYEITAVRPGEYHALAFPGKSPTLWFALTLTDSLLKRATSVTVNPGETSTIDLRAVTQ